MLCCMLYYDEGTSRPGWFKTEQRMVFFYYTYRHCRPSLLRLVDSHNENLSGHSTDSKYLHIYKGCFHRDAKESNVSYFSRLDYQPLFGKMSPHSSKTGPGRRRISRLLFQGLFNILCRPVISVGPANVFWGGFHQGRCQLVAQTQGYQLVCIWGSLENFHRDLSLFFKARPLLQIEEDLCLAGCQLIAQTQGYQLVYIWGSLVKFRGGWGCSKFWCVTALGCSLRANNAVANVPSQQAVNLEVVGPRFFEEFCFGWYFWDQWQYKKMGWIGEMVLQSVTLTLKLILKMSYFPD